MRMSATPPRRAWPRSETSTQILASEFIRNREARERRNTLAERARSSTIPPPPAPADDETLSGAR